MLLEGHDVEYVRLGQEWYVAADEGKSVLFNGKADPFPLTLQQCENACTQTDGCNSFAHCPRHQNRCWLTDRVLTGNEPTKYKYYCSTYYKKGITDAPANNKFILHRVSWFLNCYLSCILILGLSECHIKTAGFCIKNDGNNQNSGVIKKNSLNGNTTEARKQCLATCKETDGATGCEVIWDQHNRGCYVHTQEIARGNGVERHMCWVFSNCSGTWLF